MRGFTIIEVTIVVAIMALLMAVFIFQYRDSNQSVLVNTLANEVSLTLREAQFYATGVKELAPGTEDFSGWYGVSFEDDSQSYIFFADLNQDFEYDEDDDETVASYNTKGRIHLFGYEDMDDTNSVPLDRLDIVFEKGHLNPHFEAGALGNNFARVMVALFSPDLSLLRAVCVGETGRMYIAHKHDCPPVNE